MAFKYINAAISGEYQKISSRLIEDPESVDLTDSPTKNLPNDVPQRGDNDDGFLTGSIRSISFDGINDFLKLPTIEGLGTEILLEDIGSHTIKHGSTSHSIALEAWVKLSSSITGIDTNSEFFEVTIQRNSTSSTTGYDGVYMARTIYGVSAFSSDASTVETDGDGNTISAHFIDFQFATGGTFAYSLTSNCNITLDEWHHIWCQYIVSGSDDDIYFTPTPRGSMDIYIDGTLNRTNTIENLMNIMSPGNNLLPFPATADAATYGYDRNISFDGKLDELRLWLNTGTTEAISAFANKANVGLTPNQFSSQTYATEINAEFSPSADFLASWWRFENLSAVDLFSSIPDSVADSTDYGHSATPVNFEGSVDFSEEQTIIAGVVVTGLENSINTGDQNNLNDLVGGTYDHGGMCVIHDNKNEIRVEGGVENLVTCASNKWVASGDTNVSLEVLNIFYGSSAYTINTDSAGKGAIHTIDYSHLLFDKNDYTLSLRLLLTTGSPSALVKFTLGDKANSVSTTAVMDKNAWTPVILRNTATLPTSESTITGEVTLSGMTQDSSTDQGALFKVDGLQLKEGLYPASFVGPNQIRKGGEISWMVEGD